MIATQTTPLPPDTRYVLDEALSSYDINAFDHLMLTLFGDRRVICEMIDKKPDIVKQRLWPAIAAFCLQLDRYAHEIADQLPEETQQPFVAATLLRERERMESLAECHAGWNYEDSTTGGAMKRYLKHKQLTRKLEPRGQIARRLRDQASIRRYVTTLDCSSTRHAERLAEGIRTRRPWPKSADDMSALDGYFREQSENYERARRAATATMMQKADPPDVKRKRRKMLSRSASTSTTVLGRAAVSALIRGEAIKLEGRLLDFSVRVIELSQKGHGGTEIYLESGGTRLGGLCLYFNDTPALEQAAAIALHIQADEELDLLDTGNLYNVTAAGHSNPFLVDRLRRASEERQQLELEMQALAPEIARRPQVMRFLNQELLREKQADYVTKFVPLYIAPLIDRVWRDAAPRFRAFHAQARERSANIVEIEPLTV